MAKTNGNQCTHKNRKEQEDQRSMECLPAICCQEAKLQTPEDPKQDIHIRESGLDIGSLSPVGRPQQHCATPKDRRKSYLNPVCDRPHF